MLLYSAYTPTHIYLRNNFLLKTSYRSYYEITITSLQRSFFFALTFYPNFKLSSQFNFPISGPKHSFVTNVGITTNTKCEALNLYFLLFLSCDICVDLNSNNRKAPGLNWIVKSMKWGHILHHRLLLLSVHTADVDLRPKREDNRQEVYKEWHHTPKCPQLLRMALFSAPLEKGNLVFLQSLLNEIW